MEVLDAEREIWLDRMADHVLDAGLEGASLRPLARAAGTSDRMLIYYFKDKPNLITAIMGRVAMRITAAMTAGGAVEPLPLQPCLQRILRLLDDAAMAPFLRLFLQIAAAAANGDPLYRRLGEQLGRFYFAWAKMQLASSDAAAQEREAAILMQRIEGMVFLRAIGLDDINALAALDAHGDHGNA